MVLLFPQHGNASVLIHRASACEDAFDVLAGFLALCRVRKHVPYLNINLQLRDVVLSCLATVKVPPTKTNRRITPLAWPLDSPYRRPLTAVPDALPHEVDTTEAPVLVVFY